jgi:chemotaxis signal transduction protein
VARAEQMRAHESADGRVGVLKLGSQVVPVLCLEHALGLTSTAPSTSTDQHIAVTGEGAGLVGWLVDKLTRESVAGVKVAPVPHSVGGDACRWFEAVVTCANGDVVLLIDPRELSPFGDHAFTRVRGEPAFTPATIAPSTSADPVALVFSTAVFPSSPIDKYALSGRQVAAIVQPGRAIRVPGCAAHVSGVTVWRDVVVPIVDYRNDARDELPQERRLIARCGERAQSLIAFAIEDEVRMHRPAADDQLIDDVPCPPFASGVFNVNGDRVALLNVDALANFRGLPTT